MESSTFLLKDEKGKDYALFTGDTLFLGDVGRPDLAIKQGVMTKEDLAEKLFYSLRNQIMPLADDVIVYPAHGAGSACGKNLSKETWGYLGEQKETNYALRADMTIEEFVKEVTSGLTPPPQYFAKNAMMNKSGYQSFDEVLETGAIPLSPEQFLAVVEQKEALVLDVRTQQEFAKAHIPGSIFIGINGGFAPWVGALITDIQQPIVLVAPEGKAAETVTRLARVGYDNTLGYLEGGIDAWEKAGKEIDNIESISAEQYAQKLKAGLVKQTLDVRKPSEYLAQHLEAVTNFPLDYINQNMDKLNRADTYYIHCAGGYRSMIAASILRARGFENLVDIAGGWEAIEATEAPKTGFVCPSTMSQETVDAAVAEFI
jgi:rhodanese-related sulfurtransferase